MITAFELTLLRSEELLTKSKQIPVNSKLHLPDKPNIYPNLELAKVLNDRELAITFSVQNHYHGGKFELILEDLKKYLDLINAQKNITELLIVSGSNNRKINTLDILNYLTKYKIKSQTNTDFIISVAYNCNSIDQIEENQRLVQKLKFNIVNKVYIQITDNIEKIIAGIEYIRSLNSKTIICVCVFEPTASSLAKFRFRPWRGVNLSEEFLSNFQVSKRINQENIQKLRSYGVEIILTF